MSKSEPAPEMPDESDDAERVTGQVDARPRRRATLWVFAALVSALGLVTWLAVSPLFGPATPKSGGGTAGQGAVGPTVVQEAPAVPGTSTASPIIPLAPRGEAAFAAELGKANGNAPVDPDTVGIARQTCAALESGGSRAQVASAVMRTGRYDQQAAEALVSAAVANLCPDHRAGVSTIIKDGSWKAGSDVAPGRYSTVAGDGCAWLRSTNPDANSLAGIIDSGTGAGPKTVNLEDGQYLTTSQCGEWTKAR